MEKIAHKTIAQQNLNMKSQFRPFLIVYVPQTFEQYTIRCLFVNGFSFIFINCAVWFCWIECEYNTIRYSNVCDRIYAQSSSIQLIKNERETEKNQ